MKSTSRGSDAPPPARLPRVVLAAALAGVVAAVVGGAAVAGGAGVLDGAAEVGRPAVRVTGSGLYSYPVETQPRCENLDNFRGASKSFGAGGHQGVDIGTERGQEVYAVTDGVLYRKWTDLGSAPGLGWGLHGTDDTKFRYYHLDRFAPGLRVGSVVRAGQVIGYVGDTGNASPGGWHLHFEIRPGPAPHSTPVDPNPLLAIPDDCIVYWN